jgi:uncharacterized protein with PhoU and TrkA domain
MEEISLPAGFISQQLSVIKPGGREFVVLAIRHEQENWLFNPHAEHLVHAGDVMMVMTTPEGRMRLEQLLKNMQ